jgi:hypothetical protein
LLVIQVTTVPPSLSAVQLASPVLARDVAGLAVGMPSAFLFVVSLGELLVCHPAAHPVLMVMSMPPSLSDAMLLASEWGIVFPSSVRWLLGVAALGPPGPRGPVWCVPRLQSRPRSPVGSAYPSRFLRVTKSGIVGFSWRSLNCSHSCQLFRVAYLYFVPRSRGRANVLGMFLFFTFVVHGSV